MTALPHAVDAETPLKPSELQVLRAQYEKEGEMVGVQTKFNYAWGLVKSDSRNDQQTGVRLLSEIFRVSPERRRECLYYLGLGNYKLGNYGEARRYNDLLLDKEPMNMQAADLRRLIDDKVAKEGLMGVAIISGVAIAAGVVGGILFRGRRRDFTPQSGLAAAEVAVQSRCPRGSRFEVLGAGQKKHDESSRTLTKYQVIRRTGWFGLVWCIWHSPPSFALPTVDRKHPLLTPYLGYIDALRSLPTQPDNHSIIRAHLYFCTRTTTKSALSAPLSHRYTAPCTTVATSTFPLHSLSTLLHRTADLNRDFRRLAFRAISLGGLALGLGLTALLANREERQGQMSSGGDSAGHHLDASGDREVVYCHQCEHEWYRDNHGLVCPNCDGEATEIVTPDNDPRSMDDILPGFGHGHAHHAHGSDDDPDEEDIDDHLMDGHPTFFGRRMLFRDPEGPADGNRGRADPNDVNQIMNRFQEMLEGIGGGPRPSVGRSGPDQLFPPRNGGAGPGHVQYTRFSGPGFGGGVTTYTFSTGGGGTRTTIRSSSPMGAMGGMNQNDPFQSVFGNILGNLVPPPAAGRGPNAPDNPGSPGEGNQADPPVNMLLQQILSHFLTPGGAHGDAVYSQEALDRIITQLMEQNPQSNAPPPASEETIAKLPRKKLDEQMLGNETKGECTICIDDMTLGDEAVVLPCKHWFHEECVVLWLKEHNTCPICRAAIEGDAASQPSSAQPAFGTESPSAFATASGSAVNPDADRRRANLRQRGSERLASIRDEATSPSNPSSFNWRSASSRRTSDSPPQANLQPANRRVRDPSPSGRRSSRSESSSERGQSGGGIFSRLRDSLTRDRHRP
ncbi:hypothetical protein SCUP515_03209 [Seiridium cupressi]